MDKNRSVWQPAKFEACPTCGALNCGGCTVIKVEPMTVPDISEFILSVKTLSMSADEAAGKLQSIAADLPPDVLDMLNQSIEQRRKIDQVLESVQGMGAEMRNAFILYLTQMVEPVLPEIDAFMKTVEMNNPKIEARRRSHDDLRKKRKELFKSRGKR